MGTGKLATSHVGLIRMEGKIQGRENLSLPDAPWINAVLKEEEATDVLVAASQFIISVRRRKSHICRPRARRWTFSAVNHVQHISLRIVLDRIGCRIILCTLTNKCLLFVAVLMFRVVVLMCAISDFQLVNFLQDFQDIQNVVYTSKYCTWICRTNCT